MHRMVVLGEGRQGQKDHEPAEYDASNAIRIFPD